MGKCSRPAALQGHEERRCYVNLCSIWMSCGCTKSTNKCPTDVLWTIANTKRPRSVLHPDKNVLRTYLGLCSKNYLYLNFSWTTQLDAHAMLLGTPIRMHGTIPWASRNDLQHFCVCPRDVRMSRFGHLSTSVGHNLLQITLNTMYAKW